MGDAYYYLKKQLTWIGVGLGAMCFAMWSNYLTIKRFAFVLGIIGVICLMLLWTPLGVEINGATRWLKIGSVQFAPSDLAKVAMVIVMARLLSKNIQNIKHFRNGLLPLLGLLGIVCALILDQPDLGTAIAMAGTVFCMFVIAGARWLHLAGLTILGVGTVVLAIVQEPYRLERVKAFFDPWKYANDEGYQIIQSLYALGSGGLFGLGLGRSRQKIFYLPEQHTDFIFAILGEELGFIGAFFVIVLFILLAWRGFKIAMNAPDNFSSLMVAGLTVMLVLQAGINIGVVTGALPVTGITLPFISYGGTSLLFSMASIGLLLNISRYNRV